MMMRRGPGYGAPIPGGRGPPMPPPMPVPPPVGAHVSNVTNSNDFASKNSRVFVGNLNTFALNKEDVDRIFGQYGAVTGISMHKGYAFVQYKHPGEARRAVAFENGNSYGGQILDLNIVSEPKKTAPQKRSSGPGPNDRRPPPQQSSPMPQPAKRPRQDSNPSMQRSNLVTLSNSVESSDGSSRPRPVVRPNTSATRAAAAAAVKRAATTVIKAPASASQQSSSASSASPAIDVLICGVCKMQFKSLHSLAQHKKVPCRLRTSCQCQTNPPKQPEAMELDCATCDARFDSAWALCQHVQKEHNLSIFKTADGASETNNTSTAPKGDTMEKAEEKNGQEASGGAKMKADNSSSPAKK